MMTQSCKTSGRLDACLCHAVFKALSEPCRTRLLTYLARAKRAMTVSEAAACCPTDLSVVSRHLAILRDAGILHAEKRGKEVYYSVRHLDLAAILRALADAVEACCPTTSTRSPKRRPKT